jgi:hypothetical protein
MNLDVIKQKLAKHRRSAFTPVTVEGEIGPDQSKFGGVAWINEGEAWPVCGYCGKPLQQGHRATDRPYSWRAVDLVKA